MAALTKAYEVFEKPVEIVSHPVAGSTTIYKGALVGFNSSGFLVPMDHSVGSLTFAGIAQETVVNSGANGAKNAKVIKNGSGVFADAGSATQASAGKEVYAKTDNEVQVTTGGLINQYKVGTIVSLEKTSLGVNGLRVRINKHSN